MNLYDHYHSNRKLEKRIINDWDFTHRPLLSLLRDRIYKYKKVLDIGCGTGTVCFYVAAQGVCSVGIDISQNAIAMANKNAKHLSLESKTKFIVSDFLNKKGNNLGQFDLVICTEVLEHLDDDVAAVARIYSMLRKNGEVFFSVPLKTSLLYRLKLLEKFDKKVGHLRRYSKDEIVELISSQRLRIININTNQGLLRDILFSLTDRSVIVNLANRFKLISGILSFIDERLYFLGVSNITILAKKI